MVMLGRPDSGAGPVEMRPSRLAGHQVGIPLEVQRPTLIAGNSVALAFPAFAVALQIAVLDLDAGAVSRLGGEAHFPLAGPGRICLDLPLRADVPTQEHSVWRLVGQHAR